MEEHRIYKIAEKYKQDEMGKIINGAISEH